MKDEIVSKYIDEVYGKKRADDELLKRNKLWDLLKSELEQNYELYNSMTAIFVAKVIGKSLKNSFMMFLEYLFTGIGLILCSPIAMLKDGNKGLFMDIYKLFKIIRFFIKNKKDLEAKDKESK